jgi:hypothetical protein
MRSQRIGQALSVGVILFLLLGLVHSVFPQTPAVRNQRNGRTFMTLSAAIADAGTMNGDLLYVRGIINEAAPVIVDKALTIAGAPFFGGEIRGAGPTAANPAVLDVTDRPGRVLIQGLRIRVPTAAFPVHGIFSDTTDGMAASEGSSWPLHVYNCIIEQDPAAAAGAGITGITILNQLGDATVGIVQNTIRGRDFSPAAIVVDGFGQDFVAGIRSNRVEVQAGGNAPAAGNLASNNATGGILVSDIPLAATESLPNNVMVAANRLIGTADPTNAGIGIAMLDTPGAAVSGNSIRGFQDAEYGFGIFIGSARGGAMNTSDFYDHLNDGSDAARVTGNFIANNRIGVGVDCTILTVEETLSNFSNGTLVQRNTITMNTQGLDFGLTSAGVVRMNAMAMPNLPGYNLTGSFNYWSVASGPSNAGCPGTGQMVRAADATFECGTSANRVLVTPVAIFPPITL